MHVLLCQYSNLINLLTISTGILKQTKYEKKTRENKEDYYNTVMRECGTFPASLKQPWPGAVPDS